MLISFSDYERLIEKAVTNASEAQRSTFMQGVLSRFTKLLTDEDEETLNDEELQIQHQLLGIVNSSPINDAGLGGLLDRLTAISEENEDHAADIAPNIIEFWSALDSYRAYKADDAPENLTGMSENILNVLDYLHTGDMPLDRWLETPQIRQEFNQQLEELGASPSS